MEYYEIVIALHIQHSVSCNRNNANIPKLGTIIEEYSKLISTVKLSGHLFDNKNSIDVKMRKDNLGLEIYDINPRIHRAISKVRTVFVNKIPNYYKLLIPFLTEYNEANPDTLSIVQVDTKNCFYRTIVSIPHVKHLFGKTCIPKYFIDGTFHETVFMIES